MNNWFHIYNYLAIQYIYNHVIKELCIYCILLYYKYYYICQQISNYEKKLMTKN